MDFGQILDSKSYDQVCKYASMPVCQYARMQVYTCLYKKLNKKKERARPYPRLRDFSLAQKTWTKSLAILSTTWTSSLGNFSVSTQ